MSQTIGAEIYGEAIIIRFDGLEAEGHKIDMNLLADSMKGLARIVGVSGNFAATGKVVYHRDAFSLKVLASPPESHCFEFLVWLKWINENPLITTIAGGMVVSLVAYICKKAAGDKEEMKQLRGALDEAIRELGHRDESVVNRLLTTIDRMADSLRPAVKQAVAPLGETASKLTISDQARSRGISLGSAEKAAILSDAPIEVGKEEAYLLRITELDMETGSCKVALATEEENRVSAKITDPVFSLPNNVYVLAMATQNYITVKAKPTLRDGELERLFISDMVTDKA